ncbi:MAG: TIR domain-containing protein [Thermoanaerobaculia bacterium]|nr:TIR domain-containing protein [Thermoanaerobaculia bacterium]
MQPSDTIAGIKKILGGRELHPAPVRFNGDTVSAVMPVRDDRPFRYALRDGRLAGLNLAGAGLTDEQWAEIRKLEGFDLARIEALNLKDNRLGVFSAEGMSRLKWLDLSGNRLREFTPPAVNAGTLEHIWLYGNKSLNAPPPEIVQKGNEAVLNYFREQEKSGAVYVREVKLLILGEGGAGKTTLARKLLKGREAAMPLETDSTHGIEINALPFQDKSGNTYTAHLWDFGGQEIYHATHQFFLTKRSVYILVTDARKEDTDFNYWLQIVELLSDYSPVIIVQNRKGGRMRDINLSGLQGRFRNIKGLYSIDLKLGTPEDSRELERLREALELEIRHLPHLNESIPARWADIRKALEQLKKQKPFISDREYLEIAQKHDLDEGRAQFLGQFLHDLGVFLYFQDDPVLKRWLFLDNEWATRGTYNILDAPIVRDNQKGRFTRNDAAQIWRQEDYGRMLDEMLQLMMRFELCYRIPDLQPETFIAPQLLGAAEPPASLEWDNAENLQLRYQYEFMPKGLLNRFMVRMNRYILNAKTEAWKTGAILHREKASAKVVETYGVRHIHVRATGKHCKEFVTVIAEEIDRLNAGYHNLRVQKLVPCNCEVCRDRTSAGIEEPNFYEYDDLLRRKERGKATVECKISYLDVNVLRLIDDVFVTNFFTPKAKKVFISYSKEDKSYLNELKKHLKPLERLGLLLPWDDTHLAPGEEWDQAIRRELHSSDLILLLVSPDMMATDYVWDTEMAAAMERHERGEATVIPIIVRPSLWQDAPFARFAALPAKGQPVSKWENRDEAWQQVVEKIKSVVQIKT